MLNRETSPKPSFLTSSRILAVQSLLPKQYIGEYFPDNVEPSQNKDLQRLTCKGFQPKSWIISQQHQHTLAFSQLQATTSKCKWWATDHLRQINNASNMKDKEKINRLRREFGENKQCKEWEENL